MKSTEQEFIERWRAVVRHVQGRTERLRALADEIPPDPDQRDDLNLIRLFTRQVAAIANYTVAQNCLHALIGGRTGGRATLPSVQRRYPHHHASGISLPQSKTLICGSRSSLRDNATGRR